MVESALSDDEPTRRRRVALAGHGTNPSLARTALNDPAPKIRSGALRALDRLGALTDADITLALSDSDPGVRITALELAAHRGSPSAEPLLDDPQPSVVEQAAWACGEQPADDRVIGRLAELAVDHADALVREAAVAAIGALGDPAGLSAVLAATGDKPAVRRRAVLALAAFEGPDVDEAWARARSDPDRQVRDAVEELLGPG